MYSFTEENYLKAIYKLSEKDAEKITTVQNAIDYANTHKKA